MNTLLLLLLLPLIRVSITHAQPPLSQPLPVPPDQPLAVPINIRPAARGIFTKQTFRLAIAAPANLLAQLTIAAAPPHSGGHAPLLAASALAEPAQPSVASPCSQSQPCVPEPFDSVAFYTRADTAAVTLATTESRVFVTVYNWKIPGLPSKDLVGTLHIRATQAAPPGCLGAASGALCRGRGSCGEGSTRCSCQRGWGGRGCGTRLEEAPALSARPSWDGAVEAMRDSAVVRVPREGVTYVWRVAGARSRVEFRARVLRGDIAVDGARESVDGGGGRVDMIVKRAGENLGEGLEAGTRLPTLYDGGGVGAVLVKSGGVYEVVVVGDGVGNWLMGLVVDGGDAVVSVTARRCGAGGLLDCAVGGGGGGLPVGGVVGVAVAGIAALVGVVGACVVWMRKRGDSAEQKSVSGAWTDVDFRQIDAVQDEDEP